MLEAIRKIIGNNFMLLISSPVIWFLIPSKDHWLAPLGPGVQLLHLPTVVRGLAC